MSDKKAVNAQMNEDERALLTAQLSQQAMHTQEQEVPSWNRAQAFDQHFNTDQRKWSGKSINWQIWFGVPALSMACSACAIMIAINFGQDKSMDSQTLAALIDKQVQEKVAVELASQTNEQVESLVNLKLREFAAEQQVILANYRADMSAEQQQNNLSLASYVIGASRKERKEDMTDFINFINAQRKDEQLAQKIKFKQLEREIGFQQLGYQQSGSAGQKVTKPINYEG